MTFTITAHEVWTVGKYVLVFAAGFVAGALLILKGVSDSIGRSI